MRIVHLPLSWDDGATRLAIEKYMQSVRSDAPWCPSNIEFIRRINGLNSIEEVHRILFEASYLVMGLGMYIWGAGGNAGGSPPSAVTTKYNPARTWTPENAVGIGGAYLCIYVWKVPGAINLSDALYRCGIAIARQPISRMASPGYCAFSIRFVLPCNRG